MEKTGLPFFSREIKTHTNTIRTSSAAAKTAPTAMPAFSPSVRLLSDSAFDAAAGDEGGGGEGEGVG